MNYIIEKADLTDLAIDLEIRKLIKAAFQEKHLLNEGHIYNNIHSYASKPSFILVAKENNLIIGCNAFIANDFFYNGNQYVGYQSCWTATHPEHQGKKVFFNIIGEAKKLLLEEKAGFIYGLPNDNSRPIFVKKLGFVEFENVISRVFNIPFFHLKYFNQAINFSKKDAIEIDEFQVLTHKKIQNKNKIIEIWHEKCFIWGKIEMRNKFGISYSVFLVGGLKFDDTNSIKTMFNCILKKYKVSFIEIVSCKSNSQNIILKKWKPVKSMNGIIYFNINMPNHQFINLMLGAIDIF